MCSSWLFSTCIQGWGTDDADFIDEGFWIWIIGKGLRGARLLLGFCLRGFESRIS